MPKPQVASAKQRQIRRAKIIRNSNKFPSSSTNTESKNGSSSNNVELRILPSSNGSTRSDPDIGMMSVSSVNDRPPPTLHDGEIRYNIPQNFGNNNGLTTSSGHMIGATASTSYNGLTPSDSNVVSSSNPPRDVIPSSSNSMETVLSVTDSLPLPNLDVRRALSGDTSVSNTQMFPSHNGLISCSSSEIGAAAANNSCSTAPCNSIGQSFGSQSSAGDISDNISCISNQDNIFEDILNELLPPSSANTSTWQFTGKL